MRNKMEQLKHVCSEKPYYGILIGVAVGMMIGMAMNNWGVGVGVGVALGIAFQHGFSTPTDEGPPRPHHSTDEAED